jgi:hypothetical protein
VSAAAGADTAGAASAGAFDPDPELPARLLDEVLGRPEFTVHVREGRNPLGEAIERLAGAWSQLPGWVDTVITAVVIAAAIALVLWLLVDAGVVGRKRHRSEPGPSASGDLPAGLVSAAELYRQGRAAHAAGRPGEAVVLLFRAMVARLTERGLLLNDPSRTNREHLSDLRRREREAGALRAAIPPFERVRYGRAEPAASDVSETLTAASVLFPAEPQ